MKNSDWIEQLKQGFNLNNLIFRRALRSAIVVFISVMLYHYFALAQGYWVTMTAMIVVQTTVGATLRKSFHRFLGTLLGVAIASFLLFYIHNRIVIDCLVIVFLFMAYLFSPFNSLINYTFVVVPVSISVVFLIALMTPDKISEQVIFARFYDTVIGAAIGIAGALFIFPSRVKKEFEVSKKYLEKQLAEYYWAIMDMILNKPGAGTQAKTKKVLVEQALLCDRQFYLERKYEIHFQKKVFQHEREKKFLEKSERLAQQLFSLHQIARHFNLPENFQLFETVVTRLKEEIFLFLSEGRLSNAAILSENLSQLRLQLAEMAQNRDMLDEYWQEIASLASVNFTLSNLTEHFIQGPIQNG